MVRPIMGLTGSISKKSLPAVYATRERAPMRQPSKRMLYIAPPLKMCIRDRCEGGDTAKFEFAGTCAESVAYGENAGVEHADDIPRIGFFHNFSLLGHHLLRLGQFDLFPALHVICLLYTSRCV